MPLLQKEIKHEIEFRTPVKMEDCALIISKDADYAIFYKRLFKNRYKVYMMAGNSDSFDREWFSSFPYYDFKTECLIDVD